mgnify:CR=1 FL=1
MNMKPVILAIALASCVRCSSPSARELTLDAALQAAMDNHPGVEQLKAAVEQSRRQLGQARASLLPTLDYQMSASHTFDDVNSSSSAAASPTSAALAAMFASDEGEVTNALQLTWTLYDAGRGHGIRAARASLSAAERDLERFREQLSVNVFTAFMSAYLARHALAAQAQSREYFAALQKDARARFEEGLIPESDFLTFANSYDSAVIQEMNYTLQMRQAVIGLENLMHEPLAEDITLTLPEHPAPDGDSHDAEALIAEALNRRADVLAMRDRVEALEHAEEQVRGSLKPSVAMGVQYQHSENDLKNLDSNDDVAQITAQMNWRLGDGGRRRHAAGEAGARLAQFKAQQDALEWSVRREVRDACFRIQNAQDRIRVLESTLANAEKNLEIVTLRYKEGLITVTRVTDAELNLTRARLNMISARTDLALARRALTLAIGGPAQ